MYARTRNAVTSCATCAGRPPRQARGCARTAPCTRRRARTRARRAAPPSSRAARCARTPLCTSPRARTSAPAGPPSACARSSRDTSARTSARAALTDTLCCRSRGCVCRYCDTEYPDDVSLRDHVRTAHVTDIFRYQERDDPVDEEKSVARATPPATGRAKVREKRDRRIVRYHLGVSSNRRCNTSRSPASEPPAEVDVRRDGIILNDGACEFSEQSSVEDFGPLPESVFEAIEDSQEYREVEHGIDENETHRGDEDVEKLEVNDRRDPPATEEASESRRSTSGTPRGADGKGIKRRKCPKCDKVYTASSSYFYHLKYSHGQTKEHECEVCGKKFGSRASLSAHGSIHTGDRRHACARCGKAFRTAAGLYIHEQTHSGVKTHGCSWCARSFRWRTQLQRHERRHRGERPHACVTCARAFSERADLLRHARTHAAGRHACPRCGDTFAQPRYLRVHVGNKHPDESLVTRNDCK